MTIFATHGQGAWAKLLFPFGFLEQLGQNLETRIPMLLGAITRAFVPILPTLRTQSFTIRTTECVHGCGEQHIFPQNRSQVQVSIIANDQRRLNRILRGIDEQFSQTAAHRLLKCGEAASAFIMHQGLETTLSVQALRRAREAEFPRQLCYVQIRRDFHFRFVEFKITTLANALFEQKTNV